MGAIVDILLLDPEELNIIKHKYPNSEVLSSKVLTQLESYHTTHKHVIVIPEEDDDDYCDFLLEKSIAMSSNYFVHRIKHDKIFAEKMKARSAELVKKL